MYSPRPPAPMAAAIVAVPDADDRGDAHARDDRGERERNLDLAQQFARRHAHRDAGFADRSVDAGDADDRRADDRQERVQHEHHERRPRRRRRRSTARGSRKPNIARLGIVCTMPAIATNGEARPGRRAAKMPRGTPMPMATAVEIATRKMCSPSSVTSSCWWAIQKRMTAVMRVQSWPRA